MSLLYYLKGKEAGPYVVWHNIVNLAFNLSLSSAASSVKILTESFTFASGYSGGNVLMSGGDISSDGRNISASVSGRIFYLLNIQYVNKKKSNKN